MKRILVLTLLLSLSITGCLNKGITSSNQQSKNTTITINDVLGSNDINDTQNKEDIQETQEDIENFANSEKLTETEIN